MYTVSAQGGLPGNYFIKKIYNLIYTIIECTVVLDEEKFAAAMASCFTIIHPILDISINFAVFCSICYRFHLQC